MKVDWGAALKRSFAEFMADDCMGMAQQVAYSSLLAFFPAMIGLVGLLDLLGAYGSLERFLDPVAPKAVTQLLHTFSRDSNGGGSVVALLLGLGGAVWAASGAMGAVVKTVNNAYELIETRPFWKVRIVSIVLVIATGVVTAGMLLLVVLGGTLGHAIAHQAHVGGAFTLVWNVLRWPVAFVAVLLLFALVYYLAPDRDQRSWRWVTPGSLLGGLMWVALSGLFALYTAFSTRTRRRTGRLPAASSCSCG